MAYTNPTIADFQAFFNRDFPYQPTGSPTDLSFVQDTDIAKALVQQELTVNPLLFPNQNVFTQGTLLLSAHYLVQNLRAASQGIAGKFEWITNSKSIDKVSAGFSIPDRILENPEFAYLADTRYGTQFLMLVLPLLTGQMFTVAGTTVGPVNGIFSGPYGRPGPWGSPC